MSLTTLIELLERLDENHLQMLDLAAAKKQAIMDNNIESLVDILSRESKLTKISAQLEEQREQSVFAFTGESAFVLN